MIDTNQLWIIMISIRCSSAAISKCIKLLLVIPVFLFLWKPHVPVLLLPPRILLWQIGSLLLKWLPHNNIIHQVEQLFSLETWLFLPRGSPKRAIALMHLFHFHMPIRYSPPLISVPRTIFLLCVSFLLTSSSPPNMGTKPNTIHPIISINSIVRYWRL